MIEFLAEKLGFTSNSHSSEKSFDAAEDVYAEKDKRTNIIEMVERATKQAYEATPGNDTSAPTVTAEIVGRVASNDTQVSNNVVELDSRRPVVENSPAHVEINKEADVINLESRRPAAVQTQSVQTTDATVIDMKAKADRARAAIIAESQIIDEATLHVLKGNDTELSA